MQYSAPTSGSHNAVASRYQQGVTDGHEHTKQYPQFSMAPLPRPFYPKEYEYQQGSNYVPPPVNSQNTYGPISAPLLPPMHCPDLLEELPNVRAKCVQPGQPPKEEKAIGGVAAYLDYEMEQMADFVSEMAQGMYDLYESRICLADIDIIRSVHPKSTIPPAFRKYVLQVLSSTRLPSTTILLGLYYLATRMTSLSAEGRYTSGSGQVYRMLTTSLLLGSKFLDDNTFQNRSWSEVSNIPVSELNVLEIEWLLAIDWKMHINVDDPQGFMLWHKHWERWQAKKADEISLESLKLTPRDTSVRRQRSLNKLVSSAPVFPAMYNDGPLVTDAIDHLQSQWHTPPYDQWTPRSRMEYSPPSAPETGPNTPDYFARLGELGYGNMPQSYPARTIPPPSQILPSSVTHTAYSQYTQPYVSNNWSNHGSRCGCGYCVPYQDRYFMPQPVAG